MSVELLEREAVLATVADALAAARAGTGSYVLVQGPAGIGKSSVLDAARALADREGFLALAAQGSELEVQFSCGVALQLFARRLAAMPGQERGSLMERLPPAVGALLSGSGAAAPLDEAGTFALLHGLFLLTAELAETGPVALLIDDVQWADPTSLRFLLYLLARIDEVPAVVLLAVRSGESAASDLLDSIVGAGGVQVEALEPLGLGSVAAVVRHSLGEAATEAVAEACRELTGGNPFYLRELLLSLQRDGIGEAASAASLREIAPASISRSVLLRVARLPEGAGVVAQAAAVLGSGASLRHLVSLTRLPAEIVARAVDALVDAEILRAGQTLAFVHPLVAQAIASDQPAHARGLLHLEAARLLDAEGADPEHVAAHLQHAPRLADPWVVGVLRAAARHARGRGGADSACDHLERALAEPAPPGERAELLLELGEAEAAAGRASASEHLLAALDLCEDPGRRAEIQLRRGHALYVQGRHAEAAAAFDAGLAELEDPLDPRASELQAGYVAAATITPELRVSALGRADRLAAARAGQELDRGARAVLAQAALHGSLAAAPRETVRALALRAWDDGALLADETAAGFNWTLVTGALDFTDELELSLEICEAAMADARHLGSPLAFATASYERAIPLYYQGRIAEAAADVQVAVDSVRYGWEMYARSAAYTLSLCQIERGDLDAAEATLAILEDEPPGSSIEHPALLDARGVLRRRQHRWRESLADHLEAGRLFTEVFGVLTTGDVAWRLGAAEAALGGGDRDQAVALARKELEFSRSVSLTRGIIGALRVLGLALGGEEGLARLREAVEMPDPAPDRLEHLTALVDYGAALRRANRRAESREPLRRALEVASRRGAVALAARAEAELRATGAKPRRAMLTGVESLTGSELRVAQLAAAGSTNQQIAQSLFVTPKTVEFHLRNVFMKLDVGSRRQLPAALGEVVA